MSVEITYFVHGTTYDNEQEISSGWKDVDISPKGIEQSKALTDQVKDKKFDVVFCSDLKRAVRSAELSFKNLYPIVEDRRLRECNYGIYNGKPSSVVEPLQEEHLSIPFSQGESYLDVMKRMGSFLDFLKNRYDNQHIAIVAHKAPQLALDVLLNGKTWEQAFAEDWRKTYSWQPGWEYSIK